MNVRGRPSPDLEIIAVEDEFVLFDPSLLDTDLPPSENEHVIRSNYAVSLEDKR